MLAATALLAGSVNCWAAAAYRYDLPAELLYAIGTVESGHNVRARANANNGTYSVGLMQINSSWFTTLARYGISEVDLQTPCINIQVGAWILRQEVDRYGYSWEALGAYYAGPYTPSTHEWKAAHYRRYAMKVLTAWRSLQQNQRTQQIPP